MACPRRSAQAPRTRSAPELNGLDGPQVRYKPPDYSYSDADKNSGITWNEAQFKDYIKDPKAKIFRHQDGRSPASRMRKRSTISWAFHCAIRQGRKDQVAASQRLFATGDLKKDKASARAMSAVGPRVGFHKVRVTFRFSSDSGCIADVAALRPMTNF